MGFWSELKDLGKNIGGEFSNLGSELKEIGKDTVKEIKEDPKKYIGESAVQIVSGTASLAVGAAKMLIDQAPNMMFNNLKQMESFCNQGKMSQEQKESYFEQRLKVFNHEIKYLDRLIDKPIEEGEIKDRIEKLQASKSRLEWFMNLRDFEADEGRDVLTKCKDLISELKSRR